MRPHSLWLLGLATPILSRNIPLPVVDRPVLSRRFNWDDMVLDELQPVKTKPGLSKRADSLDLHHTLSLLWANGKSQATLSADFSGENENVINMDDFSDVVTAVDCTPPQLALDFVDQDAFDAAVLKWNWVNEQDDRHFIMVLDMPECGATAGWVPYNITDVAYDKERWIAYLTAHETTYEKVIHDGRLTIESAGTSGAAAASPHRNGTTTRPVAPPHQNGTTTGHNRPDGAGNSRRRAEISKDVDIGHDFSGTIVTVPLDEVAGLGVSLDCTRCTTAGNVDVRLQVDIGFFKIKKASIGITARDVVADVNFGLDGYLKQSITGTQELWAVDLLGVSIPGIARLGFGPAVGVAWNATLSGTGKLGWGAQATLTPTSTAELCFTGCDTGSEGWEVTWDAQSPNTNGSLGASVDVSTYVELTAGASVFGLSYEGGVALVAPEFRGSVTGLADTAGGVCGGDEAAVLGVASSIEVGAEAFAYVGRSHQKTDARWEFFSKYATLFDECFPMTA